MKSVSADVETVTALCKRRGFIFQSSEIYGGLASAWDYGPLGAELKRNVKNAWWKSVVHERDDMVGLDASILMHPMVWKASGHADNFTDLVVDCKKCKKRFRPDQIGKKCPSCGASDFTEARAFNLMLKTFLGAMEDSSSVAYLRPETAQGIFVNFQNVIDTTHRRLPFGIAQVGKSFRNEITPGNFTFRTREFEQMEIEYFTQPKDADKVYKKWIEERFQWYLDLGLRKENLRRREHEKDELAHYAAGCTDIEYQFPFGWSELEGIANRTEYDLKQHSEFSGKNLKYKDNLTQEEFFPYIIEPSGGCDRATLAFLTDAYCEEEVPASSADKSTQGGSASGGEAKTRTVLKLSKHLAPVKVAVLPLLKKNDGIVDMAKKLKNDLQKDWVCVYDDTAAIGKLYRRQDEIGTFYCVTVDVQSLEDKQVTVRERDTMKQERIPAQNLKKYVAEQFSKR